MTDKQVDSFLKELEKTEYKISTFDKNIDLDKFDAQKIVDTMHKSFHITYLIQELKLLRDLQEIGDVSIYGLTKKGRKVVRNGGWLKYLEREDEIEAKKERKENAEIKISEFQARNQYLPYIVSFCGVIISLVSLLITYNNNDEPSQKKEHTLEHKEERIKSETKKSSDYDTLSVPKK